MVSRLAGTNCIYIRHEAAALFPLRGWCCLQEPTSNTDLRSGLVSTYTQNVTSPEGGGGHLDGYTVTDMCVDLACCLDTLEQDLVVVVQYRYHYNTGYAWYLVLRAHLSHLISKLMQIAFSWQ